MSKIEPGRRYQAVSLAGGNVTFNPPCRAIIIAGAGVITGIALDADVASATGELPAGWHPISFKQINQTGTTATDITAVW